MTLRVNEIFGPTIQGEGPSAGRHCLFVRLSQCNLHCSWCDTPYTWAYTEHKASLHDSGVKYDRQDEERLMSADEVLTELDALWSLREHPTTVVISGGEPMLQQGELTFLIDLLTKDAHCDIEIETAGTILPRESWFGRQGVRFNVSPKLAHSGNNLIARRNVEALKKFAALQRTAFKFVVVDTNDYDEIHELITLADIQREQVWIMPEGVTPEETAAHARHVIDYALNQGWNFSMRNHVSIWGTERGK